MVEHPHNHTKGGWGAAHPAHRIGNHVLLRWADGWGGVKCHAYGVRAGSTKGRGFSIVYPFNYFTI